MQRRDLLTIIGGAGFLLGGNRTLSQTAGQTGTHAAKVVRIYATPDGGSHAEELTISPDAKPVDITRMTAGAYRGSGVSAPDWHNAPRKQFAINMTGELEVELTDGTRRKIGSDLVFLEDTTGKGHITRALGPITNVFLHVPDDFDVVAWAKGQ